MDYPRNGIILAIGIILICVVIAGTNLHINSYKKSSSTEKNSYSSNELTNIESLASKCKSICDTYSNKAVCSICKDIYNDIESKNIDKAINDSVYLSMLLEDIDDPEVNSLRFYVDEVVSSTASV